MYLTLKEIYNFDIFKKAEFQTGKDGLEENIVEWVSVIETPVENFVRKNELVLSTGIGCYEDEELFLQFVKEVIDSEASALVLATGRYIYSLPKQVLELAEKVQFPILTIPWEVRFADIMQGIYQGLNKQKIKLAEQSEEIQQRLLQIILRGGGLEDIANFIYKTIQKGVIITDKRGQIKAQSKKSKQLIATWKDYLHREDSAIGLHPVEPNIYSNLQNMRNIKINDTNVLQISIHSSSEIQGFLLIDLHHQSDLHETEDRIQLLEHAATTTALCFLKENTILETEMRIKDDFVWSLSKGTLKSWDQILTRSKSLGYNVNLPYICLVGSPENFNDIYGKKLTDHHYESWVHSMTRRMEDEIFHIGRMVECQTMFTFQRDQFIIFLEIKNNNIHQTSQHFFELLSKRLKQLLPNLNMSWGIGKTAGVNCFHESYNEALTALEMGRRLKGPGHLSTYTDTRMDRAFMTLIHNEDLKSITEATIGPLIKYDKERGIDLINTYITYSNNRGNVSQTSREMNLHRQSLLYRLRKIEALSECKLDNPDDIFLLDLTLKLWTVGILDGN